MGLTGVLLVAQVLLDVISNFFGAGLTLFFDLIFGGFVVFFAWLMTSKLPSFRQAVVLALVALLLGLQFYFDLRQSWLSNTALIAALDILSGALILFLQYQMSRYAAPAARPS